MAKRFEDMNEHAVEEAMEVAEEEEAKNEEKKKNGEEPGQCDEKWIGRVALFSAIVAILSAIATLLADYSSDKASTAQIRQLITWTAKEIEESQFVEASNRIILLEAMGKQPSEEDRKFLEKYKQEEKEEEEEFELAEKYAETEYESYDFFLFSITFFQLAVMLGAIAMMIKRKMVWGVGVGFAGAGVSLLVVGAVMYFT